MMKFLVLVCLVGAACAGVHHSHTQHINQQDTPASKEFLYRQQAILQLLEKVHIPFYYKEYEEIANSFHPLKQLSNYKKTAAVKELVYRYEHQQLKPKGQPFSIYHPEDREEAIMVFETLYYAKDWETFQKTAILARATVNEQLFVYAFTSAVLHHEELRGIKLPPHYEIFPEYFLHSKAIYQAYKSKSLKESLTINVNSTWYSQNNWESLINYYTDDVGLNTHSLIWAKEFPTWWQQQEYGKHIDRQGEFFYYAHHQLTNRYNLERLSNNLQEVTPFQWNYPTVKYGYNSNAIYRNGEEFPVRYDNMEIHDIHNKQYGNILVRDIEDYEMRIRSAVDSGELMDVHHEYHSLNNTEGIEELGKIIYGHVDRMNPHVYGPVNMYSRAVLGRIVDPTGKYNLAPSTLEQDVATRDPLFYNLHKHYDQLFKQHKYLLPSYTKEEIDFAGVTVDDVEVSELTTYLQPYEINLDNIFDEVDAKHHDENIRINARVYRLNHKPFTYQIHVNSDKEQTAVVRMYLVPKYNVFGKKYTSEEQSWQAYELDTFTAKLTTGKNTIMRKSSESSMTIPDYLSTTELKQKVNAALKGQSEFLINKDYRHCGLPARLLLPRGKPEGQEYTLAVYISDYEQEKVNDVPASYNYGGSISLCGALNHQYPLAKPLGYPFDRFIRDESVFKTGNTYFKDITITYQKHENQDFNYDNLNM